MTFSNIAFALLPIAIAYGEQVADPPPAHSPVILSAVNDGQTGRTAFLFEGRQESPVIRANPGDSIDITYRNEMSRNANSKCATGPCMNMTNLHFHGLHVSPNAPQDDVLSMMAMPGATLKYRVELPRNQPPGLYWYHPHPHGESNKQVLDGMSGAIVIEGIERYVPEVMKMRERILMLRDTAFDRNSPAGTHLKEVAEVPPRQCGSSTEQLERAFTVNGAARPQIHIAAGERQFWRIVNASPDLYADLQVDGEQMEIVALDGMPLAYHTPHHPTRLASHVLLPPAGRLEAIVTGPSGETMATLRTRCFDTGTDGDPNPSMVLADLVDVKAEASAIRKLPASLLKPLFTPVSDTTLASLEKTTPDFMVTFTEDKQGFYINGKRYGPEDAPMMRVRVGARTNTGEL